MNETPVKHKGNGNNHLDITVESTPVPQASSTIQKFASNSADLDTSFIDTKSRRYSSTEMPFNKDLLNQATDIRRTTNSNQCREKQSLSSNISDRSSLGLLPAKTILDSSDYFLNNSQSVLNDLHFEKPSPSNGTLKNGRNSSKQCSETIDDFRDKKHLFIKNVFGITPEAQRRLESEIASVSSYLMYHPEVPSCIYKSIDDGNGPTKRESDFTFTDIALEQKNRRQEVLSQTVDPINKLKASFDENEILGRSTGVSDLSKHVHEDLINFPSGRFTMDTSNMKLLSEQISGGENFMSDSAAEEMLKNQEAEFKDEFVDDKFLPAEISNFSTARNDSHITVGSNFGSEFPECQKLSASDFFLMKSEDVENVSDDLTPLAARIKDSFDSHGQTFRIPCDNRFAEVPSRDTGFTLSTHSSNKLKSVSCLEKSNGFADESTFTCSKIANLLKERNTASPNSLADRLIALSTYNRRIVPKVSSHELNNSCSVNTNIRENGHFTMDQQGNGISVQRRDKSDCNVQTVMSRRQPYNPHTISNEIQPKNTRSNTHLTQSSTAFTDTVSSDNLVTRGRSSVPENRGDSSKFLQFSSVYEWLNQLDHTASSRDCADESEMQSLLSDSNHTTDHWLVVKPENVEYILLTSIMSPVHLVFHNTSGQFLKCHLNMKSVKPEGSHTYRNNIVLANVALPESEILLDPRHPKEIEVWVSPNVTGRLQITFSIELTPASTEGPKLFDYDLIVCGENPKLSVNFHGSEDSIDFGRISVGCTASLPILLKNCGEANLALELSLEQKNEKSKFTFTNPENMEECVNVDKMTLCLPGGDESNTQEIIINFHAFNIDQGVGDHQDCNATLTVKFTKPNDRFILKQIPVQGCAIIKNVKFIVKEPLIIATDNSTREIIRSVKIRNESDTSLEIDVFLDVEDESFRNVISVNPRKMTVQQNSEATVNLCLKSDKIMQDSFNCQLCARVLSSGSVTRVNVQCIVIPKLPSSSSSSSSRSPNSPGSQDMSRISTESLNSVSSGVSCVKLKVETTHRVLSWGTVMLHKEERKTVRLKNYAEHSYKIRLSVKCADGIFKILNNRNENVTQCVLRFYPMECQAVNIVFIPNKTSAAVGRIEFEQLAPEPGKASQRILLFGYGGHAKLVVRNVSRDSTEKMWLSLGSVDTPMVTLQKEIFIENRGTLAAFCSFSSTFKGPQISSESGLHVVPSHLVIEPKSSQNVRISYTVCNQDIAVFSNTGKQVIDIAALTMISGDEPSRQRLRRIILKENNKSFSETLRKLCVEFDNEQGMDDILTFRDSVESQDTLCQNITRQEIMLTLEYTGDKTLPDLKSCLDGEFASKFSSLLQETVFVAARSEDSMSDFPVRGESTPVSRFFVTPHMLVFSPAHSIRQTLEIFNRTKLDQIFEVSADSRLNITPSDGIIHKQDSVTLSVTCCMWPSTEESSLSSNIVVYLENDSISVKVIIKGPEKRVAGNNKENRLIQNRKYYNTTVTSTPLRMIPKT